MGKNYNLTISSLRIEKYDNTKSTDDTSSKYEDEIYPDKYSESLLDGNESKEDIDEQKPSKNMRHRKRKLYNQVRDQMEFYFSDANLTKDRYLMQMIREDPCVPLDVFLNFNKIKKHVKTSDELIKALSSSTLLELNENNTRVSRTKPLIDIEENRDEIDARTIYVESLPANADHEWVKKVFQHASNGGNVSYVSLPRYKNSRKLKEFGFVEFETIDSVEKCLKTFEEFDGLLHYDNLDPINLLSIKSFIKENGNQIEINCNQYLIYNNKINTKNETKIIIKNEINGVGQPKSKRIKLNIDETNYSQKSDDAGSFEATEESDNENDINDGSENSKKKKLRKKKKKDKKNNKSLVKSNNTNNTESSRPLNLDVDLKDLKVLPKREWKRLRNKYLNLQREKINNLKKKSWQKNNDNAKGNTNKKQIAAVKHIGRLNQQIAASTSLQQIPQLTTKSSQNNITTSSTTTNSSNVHLTVNNVKNFDLKKSPHMNFYRVNKEIDGALYDEDENDSQSNDTSSLDSPGVNSPYSMLEKRRKLLSPITNSTKTEIKRNIALEKAPLFQFEPGIILKIEFNQPCCDIKQFKMDMKQYDSIKYIDVKESSMLSHIRCDTAKNAQQLLKKIITKNLYNNCEIIDGTEESKYWDKIMEDRDMKLNKRIKMKSKRGREKIPKLISNHIRFADDED